MATMIDNFRKSLKFVLSKEGGYVNDPSDRGGETKWGISKRSHPELDIKGLTPEQALNIYDTEYWCPAGCDSLTYPLCLVVFDSAVQHGVKAALNWLKVAKDVDSYLLLRKLYYISIVKKDPSQQKFLAGWLNRLSDLKKVIEVTQAEVSYDVTQLPEWHY